MMKNVLLICICLFGLALPLSAQKMDAQDILDRTVQLLPSARREVFRLILRFRRMLKVSCKEVLQGLSV